MITFEGNKIIFNQEVGKNGRYKLSYFYFGPREKMKEFLPNCSSFRKLRASKIKDSGQTFGLGSKKEFLQFITAWVVNVLENTDLDMPEEEFWTWIQTYYKSIIDFHKEFGEHTADEMFFPDLVLNEPKKETFNSVNINKSRIIIDYNVKPEISWAIVDCWKRISRGEKHLPFEDQVNAYIQENVARLLSRKKKENYFWRKLFYLPLQLDGTKTVRNIDYTDPYSLYYFYAPVGDEAIRTNILYLKNMWRKIFRL